MIFDIISLTKWLDELAVISFGLIGGVYFAFSFFVMQSLNNINSLNAIRTMNSINTVILKSPFMLLFFFSTFIAFILFLENFIFYKVLSYEGFASLIFLTGMFLCTAIKNVPLNNKLEKLDPKEFKDVFLWYKKPWNFWHNIRTFIGIASFIIIIINLVF